MKNRSVTFYATIVIVCICLLVCISVTQNQMNTIIKEKKLTDTDLVKNAPPLVAFVTVALGSFRGLLADILWLRSIDLQDEGKYFEMVQLASWMTKLQPRFTGAAAHLAWNMAYNISVTCSSPEDRWRWVQRGIELLRDEALEYNPGDPLLYKELGWIYQHKIGNIMDDANIHYKNNMAIKLMKVFGGAEPDWEKIAAAPSNMDDLKKTLEKENPDIMQLLKDNGYKSLASLEEEFRKLGKLPEKLDQVLNSKEKSQLDCFYRAQWMEQVYKLDPKLILEINRKYGKLDWRLPESQAIYWATLGLKHSKSGEDINCERMITQSLKDAFMGGRLLMVDKDNFKRVLTIPNLNVVDAVRRTFLETYERHKKGGGGNSFRSALENFTKDAVVILYTFGDYSKANEYYNYLRKDFPNNRNYKVKVDLFVLKEWGEDIRQATMKQAMDIVSGLLYRFCSFLAYGDYKAATAHEGLARFAYKLYMKSQDGVHDRMGLPELRVMKKDIIDSCLKKFPPVLSGNLRHAIENLKQQKEEKKAKKKKAKS